MTPEEILQSLLDFAQTKQSYRRKRCGRFIEGIEWSLQSLKDGNINWAMQKDRDYQRWLVKNKPKKKK